MKIAHPARRLGVSLAGQILIVDDHPSIRSLLTLIVQRAGFVVETAADGREALAKLRQRTYSVVLLDLMMPNTNGYEVLEELRHFPRRPFVIVITAAALGFAVELDPSIVHAVIRKPFDVDLVAAVIIDCARHLSNDHADGTRPDEPLPIQDSVN